MQREGGQNKLFIPPQNFFEGNRVVFQKLVKKKRLPIIKKFHGKRGDQKKNYSYPSNILEGNRVVFERLGKKKIPHH